MSRLDDYSKFDHMGDSSDDDEEEQQEKATIVPLQEQQQEQQQQPASRAIPLQFVRSKVENSNRFVLMYGDRAVYEWEQSLHDVTLYIATPPLVRTARQMDCRIHAQRLQIGVRDHNQLYMDEATVGLIDVASSTWTWADGVLTLELQKAHKGVVWEAVCQGATPDLYVKLNPVQMEEERKRLLLERWQEEHPGMDFRGATFNGGAPDPRTFMGGVSYS